MQLRKRSFELVPLMTFVTLMKQQYTFMPCREFKDNANHRFKGTKEELMNSSIKSMVGIEKQSDCYLLFICT